MDGRSDVLITDRLMLRPWREEDAHALYLHAKNPHIGPDAGWRPHDSEEHSREVIQTILMRPDSYAITLRDSSHPDMPVGSVSLKDAEVSPLANPGEAELGYWIAYKLWGHGLASEAAGRLVQRGFEELGLSRIWASTFIDNERSKRVLTKLGFRYDSTRRSRIDPEWPESDVYQLSRSRWANRVYL